MRIQPRGRVWQCRWKTEVLQLHQKPGRGKEGFRGSLEPLETLTLDIWRPELKDNQFLLFEAILGCGSARKLNPLCFF